MDEGTWVRGRGWGLWKALLTSQDADPDASVRRYGWRYSATEVIRNVQQDE